ncbi:MAG: hypothetical protein WBQ89_04050 [Candidatus Acidiferrum sp.]
MIIDANAVLTLAVANQSFKTIAGQCSKVSERCGRLQTVKLQARGTFESRECLDPFPKGEVFGPPIPVAKNHQLKVTTMTRYVKRTCRAIAAPGVSDS